MSMEPNAVGDDAILIGDPKSRRMFVFEVYLKAVHRAASRAVAGPSAAPDAGSTACFMSYNLFGINITSENFSLFGPGSSLGGGAGLDHVAFEPIRDGFRIRSCLADLVAFFEHSLPVLVVHLQLAKQQCNKSADPDDPIIATATVSLRQLARQLALAGDNEDDFAEAEIKGAYAFLENQEGFKVPGLRLSSAAGNDSSSNNTSGGGGRGRSLYSIEAEVQLRQTDPLPPNVIRVSQPALAAPAATDRPRGRRGTAPAELSLSDHSIDPAAGGGGGGAAAGSDDSYASSQHERSSLDETPPRGQPALHMVVENSPHPVGGGLGPALQQHHPVHHDEMVGAVHEANLSVVKHFRLSVDLRSVSGMKQATRVYLTYNYPQLGCHTPVRTLPPVLCNPRFEALLPNGFCMFEFAVTGHELRTMLHQWPLVLRLLRRDRYANDSVLGLAEVQMAKVLKSPLYYRCPESAKTFSSYGAWQKHAASLFGEQEARGRRAVEFRSYDRLIDVREATGAAAGGVGVGDSVVAKVRAVLYIEDLGPADETALPLQPRVMEASQPLDAAAAAPAPAPAPHTSRPSDNQEFSGRVDEARVRAQVERELRGELEREAEEALKERRRELEAAWAHKEAARQKEFDLAREESAQLDARVRLAIAEAEKKQRALSQATVTTKREFQAKVADLDIQRRKIESEYEHRLSLEAERTEALKQRLKLTKDLLAKATDRTAQVEDDFQEYKRRQRNTPEAELQNEIIQLKSDKADLLLQLERLRVDGIQEAANRAELRRQLIEVASEVSRLRAERDETVQRDMNSLRVQYLAQEQRFVLRGDRSELNHIKEDLDALRSPQPAAAPSRARGGGGGGAWPRRTTGYGQSPEGQGAVRPRGRSRGGVEALPDSDGYDDEDEEREGDRDARGGGDDGDDAEDDDDDDFTVSDDDGSDGGQGNLSGTHGDTTDLSGLSSATDASVELQRLLRERRVLSENPSYGPVHPLVRRLDAAIALQQQAVH